MLAQPNFRHRDWTGIADLTPSEWPFSQCRFGRPCQRNSSVSTC
jgi:hypothetical protein